MAAEVKSDANPFDFDESKYDVIYYAQKTCPFSLRVRATLEIKGIKYKWVNTNWSYSHSTGSRVITKPQWFQDLYKKANGRNPKSNGQSPVIKIVKTQKLYTDSLPCCRLLDNAFKDCAPSIIGIYGYEDSDILFFNEVLNGYITGQFSKNAPPTNEEYLKKFKDDLIVLESKICEYAKSDKYIFGDNATLSDICLLPYICRVNAAVKYSNLEKEFNFEQYVKDNCPRLSGWIEFVMTQNWSKNVVCTDQEYIAHFKEVYGK